MTRPPADQLPGLEPVGDLAVTPWWATEPGARDWTFIGALGGPARAAVDPRGLVVPSGPDRGPALDWWVGTGERWVVPSAERAGVVRQELLDGTPVVVTTVRVPGGEVVQRAWVVAGERPLVVVEIENRGKVPVALALALRPYDLTGPVPVNEITVDGAAVTVDGVPFLFLPRAPAAVATGTAAADSARVVLANDAPRWQGPEPRRVTCPEGGAQAAVVFPLPHTSVVRVALPAGPVRPRATVPALPSALVAGLPDALAVARGWRAHAGQGMRVSLPEERWQAAAAAVLVNTMLAGAAEGSRPAADRAVVLAALDRWGAGSAAPDPVPGVLGGAGRSGTLDREEPEATAPLLWQLGEHYRISGAVPPEALVEPVARAAHWLDRQGRRARRPWARVAAPAGDGAVATGGQWRAGAQASAAELLDRASQPAAAKLVRQLAAATLEAGTPAGGRDAGLDALLRLPAGVADREPTAAAGEAPGFEALALRVLAATGTGDGAAAAAALQHLLDAGSPTSTWAAAGGGPDPAAGAWFLLALRQLLLAEPAGPEPTIALVPVWPPAWLGQGLEVHDAPTGWGPVSFAVRWHGARPALLWELRPGPGDGLPVRLRAPGLDPTWSTTEPGGEALLGAVLPPGGLPGVYGSPDRDAGPGAGEVRPGAPEGGAFS